MPTLAVIGGTSLLGAHLLADRARRSRRRPSSRLVEARSAAARSRTRRRRSGPARRSRGRGRAAPSAISAITRSPAGWPSVSLTCLKWSRSSISSAPGDPVAAAARQLGPQVLLEAAPVLQPGQRVLAGLRAQLLHPLVAAPDQDQRRQQRRQREPDEGDHHRQVDAGPARVADDQQPGAVGDLDRRGGAFRRGAGSGPAIDLPRSTSATSTSSGRAAVAAAARSGTWKAPPAKPISAARRSADGPDRRAVAVDRPEDVDPGAADRQPHRRRRGRLAAVARPQQVGAAAGVGADVVAERQLHA